MKASKLTAAVTAGVMMLAVGVPATAGQPFGPGSSGLGDRFFPDAGNGGYDVDHYDLDLAWNPTTGELRGTTKIEARAQQNLSTFNLDFRGFEITDLSVNGEAATFTRAGQELTVTPAHPLRNRGALNVKVRYHGVPETVIDPDGALDGWIPTTNGAIALSEPQGSPSWFPVNDYLTDKASYSISMTVPHGLSAISNGRLEEKEREDGATTWQWTEQQPMASYLVMMAIGPFDVTSGRTSSGIPFVNAIDPALAADSADAVARTNEILDWEVSLFGRYPFDAVGVIAADAPNVGYALETQTRPVFTGAIDESTYVHELAHQWVGDSVSLATWPEMWLNEGFASYTEWLWAEHEGTRTAQAAFDESYARPATDPFWNIAPGQATLPGPADLFSGPVYDRGAMTLHQLRLAVGDSAFFTVLKQWTTRNRYGNVTTDQFIALAEKVSGKNLSKLFTTWLATPGKPVI